MIGDKILPRRRYSREKSFRLILGRSLEMTASWEKQRAVLRTASCRCWHLDTEKACASLKKVKIPSKRCQQHDCSYPEEKCQQ